MSTSHARTATTMLRLRTGRHQQAVPRGARQRQGRACACKPGEIHAVLGENGAGKSTHDEDDLRRGAARRRRDPLERPAGADRQPGAGARAGHQHGLPAFLLFDTLTAAENVWLGLGQGDDAGRGERAHRRGRAHLRAGRRPAAAGAHAVGGRAPARGDRARAADRPAAADPGRADLGADAAGGGQALRHAAPAGRRGLLASSTSATSSTRSARCATTARCCAAARSPARSTRRRRATPACRA